MGSIIVKIMKNVVMITIVTSTMIAGQHKRAQIGMTPSTTSAQNLLWRTHQFHHHWRTQHLIIPLVVPVIQIVVMMNIVTSAIIAGQHLRAQIIWTPSTNIAQHLIQTQPTQ